MLFRGMNPYELPPAHQTRVLTPLLDDLTSIHPWRVTRVFLTIPKHRKPTSMDCVLEPLVLKLLIALTNKICSEKLESRELTLSQPHQGCLLLPDFHPAWRKRLCLSSSGVVESQVLHFSTAPFQTGFLCQGRTCPRLHPMSRWP